MGIATSYFNVFKTCRFSANEGWRVWTRSASCKNLASTGDSRWMTVSFLDASLIRRLLFHHLGDDEAARHHCEQALLVGQGISGTVNAGPLTVLGHALLGLGQPGEAADAYRQALALRRELDQPHLATEALAGLARVSLVQGNLHHAQAQVEEVLSHLETKTPSTGSGYGLEGTDEPFRVYLTCYRVLRVNQDPRAQEILTTAHRLLQERAAKISDEKLRRSFLENVAAHREIGEEIETLK